MELCKVRLGGAADIGRVSKTVSALGEDLRYHAAQPVGVDLYLIRALYESEAFCLRVELIALAHALVIVLERGIDLGADAVGIGVGKDIRRGDPAGYAFKIRGQVLYGVSAVAVVVGGLSGLGAVHIEPRLGGGDGKFKAARQRHGDGAAVELLPAAPAQGLFSLRNAHIADLNAAESHVRMYLRRSPGEKADGHGSGGYERQRANGV